MHDDITVSCLNVQMHNKNEPQVKLNFGVSKMAETFQCYINPTSLFIIIPVAYPFFLYNNSA